MTRKIYKRMGIISALLFSLLFVQTVLAHPLGNFSINRYSRVTISDETVSVFFVVDRAEIPAFQNRTNIDTDGDDAISDAEQTAYLDQLTPQLLENLTLSFDGTPVELTIDSRTLTFPEGQGGLLTERLEMTLVGTRPAGEGQLFYADNNFTDRVGWQEIVVQADGVEIDTAGLPTEDVSQALTQYPDELLQQPLRVSEVTVPIGIVASQLGGGDSANVAPTNDFVAAVRGVVDWFSALIESVDQRFTQLIEIEVLTPRIIAIALLIAFALGAGHALSPGHGKTIVGAYLVGSRGTAKHALYLGLITTITHTIGVFALGLLVLFASRYILPEALYPWLAVLSGLLVFGIGLSLMVGHAHRLSEKQVDESAEGYHTHFGIGHTHVPPKGALSWRNLTALGVTGGLIPCPSALVVLLSAIALQRIGFGLILIFIFSLGLATVLTLLGLSFVYAGRFFERATAKHKGVINALPIVSAVFVTLAGIGITMRAFFETGIF